MANWLLDYIEMTEYIPLELREQLTSIRELDLQVHNAMDDLERDIKQFFSKIDSLSQEERQDQFDQFLRKCDVATQAASDKVRVADKLHELVEKSMRLLDHGLEKLKEDLLEGDKAYIVEDLERRSQELDEQLRIEQETMMQRQMRLHELKTQTKGQQSSKWQASNGKSTNSKNSQLIHRNSTPASQPQPSSLKYNHINSGANPNHRNRHNSTGSASTAVRQKKRERKRLNSTLSIFNRTSLTEDDSATNHTLLSSPLTPDYPPNLKNSNNKSLNEVGGDTSNLTMKGMIASNRNSLGFSDKSNSNDSLTRARQPILTAMDAAHAVSPNATNSDKLVLFTSNANGDNYNPIYNNNNKDNKQPTQHQPTNRNNNQQQIYNHQFSNHLAQGVGFNPAFGRQPAIPFKSGAYDPQMVKDKSSGPFSSLPLSSRHDPLMIAASQAISATQNMTSGRRTSSLKASYAAVNSGRLQTAPNQQQSLDQFGAPTKIYCYCGRHIEGADMIACDNEDCKLEWFHYECVGIKTPPVGDWFCKECATRKNCPKSSRNEAPVQTSRQPQVQQPQQQQQQQQQQPQQQQQQQMPPQNQAPI